MPRQPPLIFKPIEAMEPEVRVSTYDDGKPWRVRMWVDMQYSYEAYDHGMVRILFNDGIGFAEEGNGSPHRIIVLTPQEFDCIRDRMDKLRSIAKETFGSEWEDQ